MTQPARTDQQDAPLVSVVMPVFNEEEHVAGAIASRDFMPAKVNVFLEMLAEG